MGHFNNLEICGKKNTEAHMKSSKFLEWVEDCFLIQTLDVSTGNEAQLDLLLTNQLSCLVIALAVVITIL